MEQGAGHEHFHHNKWSGADQGAGAMCERAVGEMSLSSLLRCDGDQTLMSLGMLPGARFTQENRWNLHSALLLRSCSMGEQPESGIGAVSSLDSTSFKRNCGWWDWPMSLNAERRAKAPSDSASRRRVQAGILCPGCRFHHTWRTSPGVEGDFFKKYIWTL